MSDDSTRAYPNPSEDDANGAATSEIEARRRRWRWAITIVVALLILKVVCCILLWFEFRSVRDAVDRIAIDEKAAAKLEEALAQIDRLEGRLAGQSSCPAGGDTNAKSGQGSSQTALLQTISVSDCAVEFVFQSSTPPFSVDYTSGPTFVEDPSGDSFAVQGSAFLVIEMEPASRFDLNTGTQVYTGGDVITPSDSVVGEVHLKGDFEANLDWVIGLDSQRNYSISVESSPPRIVVSFHD